jgi:hypothetical protein
MKGRGLGEVLGSAGCQPAVLGSLPSTLLAHDMLGTRIRCLLCRRAAGKRPAAAGWQPALPGTT